MKKNLFTLCLIQILLSLVSGLLTSNMSGIGRVMVSTFYRDYTIFKSWWKTAIVMAICQLILILILFLIKKLKKPILTRIIAFLFLLLAIGGMSYSYIDFTETSHRVMKIRFHSGIYLFFIGMTLTCLYFIFSKHKKKKLL